MNGLRCTCPLPIGIARDALCPAHGDRERLGMVVAQHLAPTVGTLPGHHCRTCTCPHPIDGERSPTLHYLSNIITKLERDGEWVLTGGDRSFLQRAITLIAQGQPKP